MKEIFYQLRFKILFLIVLEMVLFFGLIFYFLVQKIDKINDEQMKSYGDSLVRNLAEVFSENLFLKDYSVLQTEVNFFGENNPAIDKISIHSEGLADIEYFSGRLSEKSADGLLFSYPIIHYEKSAQKIINLGTVEIRLSPNEYQTILNKEKVRFFYLALFLIFIFSFVLYFLIRRSLFSPVLTMAKGMRIIASGDLNHRLEIKNKDELGFLAREINKMTDALRESQQIIENKNRSIRKAEESLLKNVSDLEIAKTKLEEERNKTFSILANLIDPVIVINENGELMLFNPATVKFFNFSTKDIGRKIIKEGNQKNIMSSFSLDALKKFFKYPFNFELKKEREKNLNVVEELTIDFSKSENKNNNTEEQAIFKIITSPVTDVNGKILGYMKIFYDLTREKSVDRMKSEFISIAAHQLRGPLTGIKWSLFSVINGEIEKIGENLRGYLSHAYDVNEKIIRLVDELLDVSRIEEGRFIQSLAEVSVWDIIKEAVFSVSALAEKKKIEIKFKKPKNEFKIKADLEKINLVFQNLLENAIKYSFERSQIFIEIMERRESAEDFVQISVADSGIGIKKEEQPKIFSKFFRAKNARRLHTEGSGLGLFIVKNIVESHRGKIWFESDENKGATFFIQLPIIKK